MEQTSVTQESKGFYKLNWLQRIGFGSGDLAQNLIYQTICMYLLFFYTDIYGLNPGVAATMFLVVRLAAASMATRIGTPADTQSPPTFAMNIRTEVRMVISSVSRVSEEFKAP